jgi:hypothetical protein
MGLLLMKDPFMHTGGFWSFGRHLKLSWGFYF